MKNEKCKLNEGLESEYKLPAGLGNRLTKAGQEHGLESEMTENGNEQKRKNAGNLVERTDLANYISGRTSSSKPSSK